MDISAVFLATFLVLFPFPDGEGQECITGTWKRHDAFGKVFSSFPNRIDLEFDGYIAPVSCDRMNQTGALILGGKVYHVKAADCLNRTVTPLPSYHGDIDDRLWYDSGVHNAPVKATICWD